MRTAILTRKPSKPDGTFGTFVLDDGTSFCSGELPWADNDHGTSCIPPGPIGPPEKYTCKWINSPKHGECYEVMGVLNRSMIEIHSANFMGDTTMDKVSQLLGCIALGKSIGMLQVYTDGPMQMAILQSRVAIQEFEDNMNKEDFTLTIQ